MASFDLFAGAIWPQEGAWIPDAVLSVRQGRIAALRPAGEFRPKGRVIDLRPWVVVPGFVNAHVHLELTGLSLRRPRAGDLGSWIRELVQAREAGAMPKEHEAAAAGIRRTLASGTTTLGEIETLGASYRALRESPVRTRLFREFLGLDPTRAHAIASHARASLHRTSFPKLSLGLSPHATYSLSAPLWEFAARESRQGTPLSIHLAESRAEREMLERGRGDLVEALRAAGKLPAFWRAPGKGPLDFLAAQGLLRRSTLLVHGNDLRPKELDRVRRSGCSLVYCPGSHRFFRYPPYPLRGILKRGIPLALGTDSLASNEDLSILREMALVRRVHPWVGAERVLSMATQGGARALGWEKSIGQLRPGMEADFVVLRVRPARSPKATLEKIVSAQPQTIATFIAGRCAFTALGVVI